MRLAHIAINDWESLDGYAVAHGMPDLRELPLARFANFVWFMLSRNRDGNDMEKLRARLWQPPPQSTAPIPEKSPWSPQNETNALAALKAGLGMTKSAPPET